VFIVSLTFFFSDAGHVEYLEKAKSLGDFLIVGIYSDKVTKTLKHCLFCLFSTLYDTILFSKDVNLRCGDCYPIMNMQERTLTVLSTRVSVKLLPSFLSFPFLLFNGVLVLFQSLWMTL
jgi:hypothetical protein